MTAAPCGALVLRIRMKFFARGDRQAQPLGASTQSGISPRHLPRPHRLSLIAGLSLEAVRGSPGRRPLQLNQLLELVSRTSAALLGKIGSPEFWRRWAARRTSAYAARSAEYLARQRPSAPSGAPQQQRPSSGFRAVTGLPLPSSCGARSASHAKNKTDGTVETNTPRKKPCQAVM